MAQQNNSMLWIVGIGAVAAWWAYENGYLSSIFGTPTTAAATTTETAIPSTSTFCYDVDGYPMTCPSGTAAGSTVSGSLSPLNPSYTAPATTPAATPVTSTPATPTIAPMSPGTGVTSAQPSAEFVMPAFQYGNFGRRQPGNQQNWTPPSSSASSSDSSSGTSGIGYASRVSLRQVHRRGIRNLSIGAIMGGL